MLIAPSFLGLHGSAHAIELERRFGLGPGFGTSNPAGWSANARANYFFSNAFGLEGSCHHIQYSNSSTLTDAYSLNLLIRLFGGARFTPVLGLGAGYASTSKHSDPKFDFSGGMAAFKLGFDLALTESVVVGMNAKYDAVFANGSGQSAAHRLLPQIDITFFFEGQNKITLITRSPP